MMVTKATQVQQQAEITRLRFDPVAFRERLLIDADGKPCRYTDAMDDWQAADFAALDPAWRRIAGQTVEPSFQRAWLERGRGHSKTTDLAAMATWVLFSSQRKISGVAVAGDKDQARLIANAIDQLLRLNPWLAMALDCQKFTIVNRHTGSELTILSSDAATSYGLLIDFCICDEIHCWQSRALWDSVFSAIAKRRNALLLVITNAGFCDHWTWTLREAIIADPAWYFHRLEGPVASWLSVEHLAEQERLLLRKEYQRLWLNQPVDSGGDALSSDDIRACITLPGPLPYSPHLIYCGSVDLGIVHDRTALVILAADTTTGMVELVAVKSWRPGDYADGEICLADVQHEIIKLNSCYNVAYWNADVWQARKMVQDLSRLGLNIHGQEFNPKQKDRMARALLEGFRNKLFRLWDCPELLKDFSRLRIAENSIGGYRLDAIKDKDGHADAAVAFAMCSMATLGLAQGWVQVEHQHQRQMPTRIMT
jgi:hypothetical protein